MHGVDMDSGSRYRFGTWIMEICMHPRPHRQVGCSQPRRLFCHHPDTFHVGEVCEEGATDSTGKSEWNGQDWARASEDFSSRRTIFSPSPSPHRRHHCFSLCLASRRISVRRGYQADSSLLFSSLRPLHLLRLHFGSILDLQTDNIHPDARRDQTKEQAERRSRHLSWITSSSKRRERIDH